jgi:hypothetical protein
MTEARGLLEAAANREIDVVIGATAADLALLDDYAALGWRLMECGCIVRIGGPFDEPHHGDPS